MPMLLTSARGFLPAADCLLWERPGAFVSALLGSVLTSSALVVVFRLLTALIAWDLALNDETWEDAFCGLSDTYPLFPAKTWT